MLLNYNDARRACDLASDLLRGTPDGRYLGFDCPLTTRFSGVETVSWQCDCQVLIVPLASRCDGGKPVAPRVVWVIPMFHDISVGNVLARFWLDVCPRHPGAMWAKPVAPVEVWFGLMSLGLENRVGR